MTLRVCIMGAMGLRSSFVVGLFILHPSSFILHPYTGETDEPDEARERAAEREARAPVYCPRGVCVGQLVGARPHADGGQDPFDGGQRRRLAVEVCCPPGKCWRSQHEKASGGGGYGER